MRERDESSANLDISNDYAREFEGADQKRYDSARWWRRVNRLMSVVGLMIIAAVVSSLAFCRRKTTLTEHADCPYYHRSSGELVTEHLPYDAAICIILRCSAKLRTL